MITIDEYNLEIRKSIWKIAVHKTTSTRLPRIVVETQNAGGSSTSNSIELTPQELRAIASYIREEVLDSK